MLKLVAHRNWSKVVCNAVGGKNKDLGTANSKTSVNLTADQIRVFVLLAARNVTET